MPALTDEIARLSKENSELRRQISNVKPEENVDGLSSAEIEELLAKKELISVFEKLRPYVGSPFGISGREQQLNELRVLGLLAPKGFGSFEFTNAGRVLSNRLEPRS